jgi:hypothetical protein
MAGGGFTLLMEALMMLLSAEMPVDGERLRGFVE